MEKRAIETSRQKMAENELEAEKRRLLEEKRLLEKIETGGGKWAFLSNFSSFIIRHYRHYAPSDEFGR